jgi:hypothetical protein
MSEVEYQDYKREVMLKASGANIHKVYNLLNQLNMYRYLNNHEGIERKKAEIYKLLSS